jgi:hypothetical protein
MNIERKREQNRAATRKYRAKLSSEKKQEFYKKRRTDETRTYAREWARRKYANDEDYRQKIIQKSRQYISKNRTQVNEVRRRRYQGMTVIERHHINVLRRHGLSPEQYADMLAAQKERCAICGNSEPGGRWAVARLYIDHCHVTGKVRGLLCNRCNVGLARFQDDPNLLLAAAAYPPTLTSSPCSAG